MAAQVIDHEAATREIAKGLELTTRLHSLLRASSSSGQFKSEVQLESLSQEIMQALVAALSILMKKPTTNINNNISVGENKNRSGNSNNNDTSKLAVAVAEPGESTVTTTTTTAATTATPTARVRLSNQPSAVALDISLACTRRDDSVTAEIPASEGINQKNDRKRSQLHSGTMISYEHSSDDYERDNHVEKKVNKTKLPRNHLHSWTTITSTPFNDGYQWRKYGEKKICNSKMPRCYYRCTFKDDQNCPATKQVQQKDSEDPPMFVVTYKQQHSCRNRNLPISPQHVVVEPPPVVDPCHLRL